MPTPYFSACDSELFHSRQDINDPRLGDLVNSPHNQDGPSIAVLGYPDDEGISLNKGRPGARQAPDAIRKMFYRMTPDLSINQAFQLVDLGNLNTEGISLEQRHQIAKDHALQQYQKHQRLISLGGGHDYGYPDVAAFLQHCQTHNLERPLVLNFDAHLDVRPTDKGLSSGTPFYRILSEFSDFDFAQIGIQSHCNSQQHWQWCKERNVRILAGDTMTFSADGFASQMQHTLDDWLTKSRPCFVSIDIDGFDNAYAMGCSQSWPTGFAVKEFFQAFEMLLRRLDVLGVGVYEVSPPLDQDHRTAKLAALILHRFVFTSIDQYER